MLPLRRFNQKALVMPTSPSESTMPSPQEKPRCLLREVEEWNRLLDYEEMCVAITGLV